MTNPLRLAGRRLGLATLPAVGLLGLAGLAALPGQKPGKVAFRTGLPGLAEVHKNLELLMTSTSRGEVRLAICRLGCSGKAAVPGLCLLLKDPRLEVRRRAYRALEDLGDLAADAIPILVQRMRSGNRWEQVRAAQLAQGIDPDCEAAIFALAETVNVEYRRRSAKALPRLPSEKAVRTLSTLLADEHGTVRRASLRAAADMGERAAPLAPQLAAALTGPEATSLDVEDIPGAIHGGAEGLDGAERALAAVGKAAVPTLLKHHAKGGGDVQLRVLRVLGAMGEAEALRQAARVSMRSGDRRVRRIAVACLAQVPVDDGSEFAALAGLVVARPDEFEMQDLLAYLERVASPLRVLGRGLRDRDPRVRRLSVAVCGHLEPGEDPSALQEWTTVLLRAARDREALVAGEVQRVLCARTGDASGALLRATIPVAVALQRRGMEVGPLLAIADRLKTDPDKLPLRKDAARLARVLRGK